MENASKALLMAGGILIAIILIAVLVRTFGNVSAFQKSRLTEQEQQQLKEFNEQYTKYAGQYVYGTDVITVINKILNNTEHKMETVITLGDFSEPYTYKKYKYVNGIKQEEEITVNPGGTLSITNEDTDGFIDLPNNSLKNRAFKCIYIGYDNDYGRVNYIKFEEKKWGDLT